MLMGRCEFDNEDYSFNIVNLTDTENAPEFVPKGPGEDGRKSTKPGKRGNRNPTQGELF